MNSTHLVELDDVRVVQHLHDLDLPVDLLQVDGIQLGFVYDLDGHLRSNNQIQRLNNESSTSLFSINILLRGEKKKRCVPRHKINT